VSTTILLAEDDEGVRRMMRVLLQHHGDVTVIEAADGREALLVCEADGLVVDLVIVDLEMPRMDGAQLVELLAARPRAPRVLVCSGVGGIEGLPWLAKPFTPQALRAAVDSALAGPDVAALWAASRA